MIAQRKTGPQAFGLKSEHGCRGVGNVVVQGLRSASLEGPDAAAPWVAIGECLNAIVEAHRTTH